MKTKRYEMQKQSSNVEESSKNPPFNRHWNLPWMLKPDWKSPKNPNRNQTTSKKKKTSEIKDVGRTSSRSSMIHSPSWKKNFYNGWMKKFSPRLCKKFTKKGWKCSSKLNKATSKSWTEIDQTHRCLVLSCCSPSSALKRIR